VAPVGGWWNHHYVASPVRIRSAPVVDLADDDRHPICSDDQDDDPDYQAPIDHHQADQEQWADEALHVRIMRLFMSGS
jgi:hypothetical protein